MKIKKINIKRINSEHLIFMYLFINVFCKSINLYNRNYVYKILFFLGIGLLFLKVITDKYNLKELIICSIFIALSSITFFVSKRPTLLIAILTICSLKNVEIEKSFKGMLTIRTICFVSLIVLSLLGIIPNRIVVVQRELSYILRYGLGHDHPNHLHFAFFLICSLYTFIKEDKLKKCDFCLIILMNQVLYYFSASRSGYVCTLLLVILYMAVYYLKINKFKVFKLMGVVTLTLSLLFSFYTASLYGKNEFVNDLNVKFSNRIAYNNYYLDKYGQTLFGSKNVEKDELANFDNSYIFVYTQYGVVGLIILLYFLYKIGLSKKLNCDYRINIMLTTFSIYLIEESFMPNIFLNTILLFGGYVLFEQKEVNRNAEENNNIYPML